MKEQPKETLLAAAVTAFCIGAPIYASYIAANRAQWERERKEADQRRKEADRRDVAEKEAEEAKNAKHAADLTAINAEAEASAAACRSRNDDFASRQPAKPLGGLSGNCIATIASPAQPKLDAPSNEEFQKSLHVDAGQSRNDQIIDPESALERTLMGCNRIRSRVGAPQQCVLRKSALCGYLLFMLTCLQTQY